MAQFRLQAHPMFLHLRLVGLVVLEQAEPSPYPVAGMPGLVVGVPNALVGSLDQHLWESLYMKRQS